MTTVITRAALSHLLEQWRRHEVTHGQVHAWAEARYAVSAYTPEDEVANEVLAALDILDMNITTDAEVPYLLAALQAADADEAARILQSIPFDLEARRKQCGSDPVYGPFLRAS